MCNLRQARVRYNRSVNISSSGFILISICLRDIVLPQKSGISFKENLKFSFRFGFRMGNRLVKNEKNAKLSHLP